MQEGDLEFECIFDEELKDGDYLSKSVVIYKTAETSNSRAVHAGSMSDGYQNLNAVEWWRFAIRSIIKDNNSKNGQ